MLGFAGNRGWIYMQHVDGSFQRIRRWTFFGLHLILFGLPWLRVRGNPALLFDLPDRRLYAFGAIFTAADTIMLLLVLLFLAFALFFFTSLFGRLWCGYGCPQTVLIEAWVRPIERWLEGERTTRVRRDAGPWTMDRAWRKAAKWSLFATAAFVVSLSFMSFFTPARELWTLRSSTIEYALVGIFATGWFLDFAWFREQFCNYLCPYARFQSALMDDNTLIIRYDEPRGEPRGGSSARVEGRCLDCSKCFTACPQGIDIRKGFQLECIGCARCIDACAGVMGKFGHTSLIGYDTLAAASQRQPRYRRPRTVAYAGVLSTIAAALIVLLATRVPFEASVTRAPGSLYTVDPDGYVRNTYLLRVANNAPGGSLAFQIELDGLNGAELLAPELELESTEGRMVPLVVRVPLGLAVERTLPMKVRIASRAGERVLATTFKSSGAANSGQAASGHVRSGAESESRRGARDSRRAAGEGTGP